MTSYGNAIGKQPWITEEILGMCDTRKTLQKVQNTAYGEAACREIGKSISKGMKNAEEDLTEEQCTEVEDSLIRNNSMRSF